jgi:UDP-sugar diphosphatase
LDELEPVNAFLGSLGIAGCKLWVYYAEVTNDQRVSAGGGAANEQENIEVVHMSFADTKKLVFDNSMEKNRNFDAHFPMAFYWFLHHKAPKLGLV